MPQSVGKRANQISHAAFGRPVGDVAPASGPITMAPVRNGPLDRGYLPHYWYPQRDGVESPPIDFAARLSAVKSTLAVVRPPPAAPVLHCWYLWEQRPEVTHALCPGWFLLMAWEIDGQALPLDEKFFAALWHFDPRNCGTAVQHFDRVIAERDRQRTLERTRYDNGRRAVQKEYRDSLKISTAGAGNRFALHHDGTLMPSAGELAWSLERRRFEQPSEMVRAEKEDRERRHDG